MHPRAKLKHATLKNSTSIFIQNTSSNSKDNIIVVVCSCRVNGLGCTTLVHMQIESDSKKSRFVTYFHAAALGICQLLQLFIYIFTGRFPSLRF